MLLIDIINELEFGGADFLLAIEAAKRRKRLLNPILRRVLEYAATEPEAYRCRFSPGLLAASAYLLAETQDEHFLRLAAPLIDQNKLDVTLIGADADDDSRLICAAVGMRIEKIVQALRAQPQPPFTFSQSALSALLLRVRWSPEMWGSVVSALRSLLNTSHIALLAWEVRADVVECCCRLDPEAFSLSFQMAVERCELDEAFISDALETSKDRVPGTVYLEDWDETDPLQPDSWYLREHWIVFKADDLVSEARPSPPDSAALTAFNRIAYPSRELIERMEDLSPVTPALLDVATRVVGLAASSAERYREERRGAGVAAAICLGAPAGDPAFTGVLLDLLRQPSDDVASLIGDDLTEVCVAALAISARRDPWQLRTLVEDESAEDGARSTAIGALSQLIDLGVLSRDAVAEYCRELVGKGVHFFEEWCWADLANLSAKVGAVDLKPQFQAMCATGGPLSEYTDARSLDEDFANPRDRDESWEVIDSLTLLEASELCNDHRKVREFLGCFEPPDYEAAAALVARHATNPPPT